MATTDLLTLAEAKVYVGVADLDTSYDSDLQRAVTAVSEAMDEPTAFGPAVTRTVADEVLVTSNSSGVRLSSARTRLFPVTSFASVVEYVSGTPTVLTRQTISSLPEDGYYAWPYPGGLFSGLLGRRSGGECFTWNGDALVTYVAGRFANTTAVPARWKEAAGLILQQIWQTREPSADNLGDYDVPRSSFPRFDIPNAAKLLLWGEWQGDPIR